MLELVPPYSLAGNVRHCHPYIPRLLLPWQSFLQLLSIHTSIMNSTIRLLPRAASRALSSSTRSQLPSFTRPFSAIPRLQNVTLTRPPPSPPEAESAALRNGNAPTYLGTTKRLPEFNLVDKVVLVSGAARGLGLVQAEALLEAGAKGMSPEAPPPPYSKLLIRQIAK